MTKFILFLCTVLIISFANICLAEGREGEALYKQYCTTCHQIGVANAPKVHDLQAWKSKNKTVDELVASSKKGLNAMPPMGMCMDCTDQELKAVIEFMMKAEVKK